MRFGYQPLPLPPALRVPCFDNWHPWQVAELQGSNNMRQLDMATYSQIPTTLNYSSLCYLCVFTYSCKLDISFCKLYPVTYSNSYT